MTITISEATQNDIPELREIFLTTRMETFSWVKGSAYELADFDKETEGEYILVAHSNNEIAGFISLWMADNFIHHLYVKSSLHGFGIGKLLLDSAIEKVAAAVRLKCIVENIAAINFYRQYGFAEIERGSSSDGEYILFEMKA